MALHTHVIECNIDPNITPASTGMHWVNTATGDLWFSKGTSTVGDWVKIDADTDEKAGVSNNDTTPGYLADKISVSDESNTTNILELKELNDGADETLKVALDETKIDHDNLSGYVANEHIDWTTDQGATNVDDNNVPHTSVTTGNPHSVTFTEAVTADSGTDMTAAEAETLTDGSNADSLHAHAGTTDENVKVTSNDTTAGYALDKIQAGTNITITENNDGGNETMTIAATGELTAVLAGVQARKSTVQALTTAYVDVPFNQTDEENDANTIEHDNTDTDRIVVKEAGLYRITYHTTGHVENGATSVNWNLLGRVRKNDAVVLDGSTFSESDHYSGSTTFSEDPNISISFIATLAVSDFLSLQASYTLHPGDPTPSTIELLTNTTMTVVKLEGAKGDAGGTGAGANIIVQKDDVTVGTVTDTLNFEGNVTSVVDEGSNKTTVTVGGSVFGTEYELAESLTDSTTTTIDYSASKISHTTPTLPAGDYRIEVNWEMQTDDKNNSVFAKLVEDASDVTSSEREFDPVGVDANKNNFHSFSFKTKRTLTNATHTFDLKFKNETSGKTNTMSNATFEIWRVS